MLNIDNKPDQLKIKDQIQPNLKDKYQSRSALQEKISNMRIKNDLKDETSETLH